MASLSPSRLVAAWRDEAPFYFLFRWARRFAFSLIRFQNLQDATLYSRKDPLIDCGHSWDTLFVPRLSCSVASSEPSQFWCRRFTERRISIWLATRRCRPNPSHADKWRPCPLSGEWLNLQDLINPALLFPIRSLWRTSGRRSPSSSTLTLEARCSSTTSNSTKYLGWQHMCPYSWW